MALAAQKLKMSCALKSDATAACAKMKTMFRLTVIYVYHSLHIVDIYTNEPHFVWPLKEVNSTKAAKRKTLIPLIRKTHDWIRASYSSISFSVLQLKVFHKQIVCKKKVIKGSILGKYVA